MENIFRKLQVIGLLVFLPVLPSFSQIDTTKFKLEADFRGRVEHDWNSRRSDGSYREDRSRLRLRARFGFSYQYNEWASFGARLRTGNVMDQQGPHVTLGSEFGLISVGFEKAYFQAKHRWLTAWFGKNTFPFWKQNELFWNDNVFPEGIAFKVKTEQKKPIIIQGGHFIIASRGKSFSSDAFFDGIQFILPVGKRMNLVPGFFYFRNVSNSPDESASFLLNYSLLNPALEIKLHNNFKIAGAYYYNLSNLEKNDSIPEGFDDQKQGFTISMKYRELEQKGDWIIHLYLANLQKFSIVDYFAQNDWARWDYSGEGAAGARLSNFRGFELRIGYAFGKEFDLIFRGYAVEEIKPLGIAKENGLRARIDMNIGF